jgi:hypothetical protein
MSKTGVFAHFGSKQQLQLATVDAAGQSGIDGTFSVILFGVMPRLVRIVAVNVAHEVTQRGSARQCILAADNERLV